MNLTTLKNIPRVIYHKLQSNYSSVEVVHDGKDVFMWLPTAFANILHIQILSFMMDHKLGRVGSEKSCSVLIISPLVALMMYQPVIHGAQSFWIQIVLNRCNNFLLALNL